MTQQYLNQISDTTAESGNDLAARINAFDAAHKTNQAGAARPTGIAAGGLWTKKNGNGTYTLMLFDGATDHEVPFSANLDFSGRLLGMQVFDIAGSGTYTPTSGAKYAVAHVIGGGGGGGGADGDRAHQIGCGGGGASGSDAVVYFEITEATYSYTVGSGGVGADGAAASPGSDGAASSLTGTNLTISCPGGVGGQTIVDNNATTADGGDPGAAPTISGTDVIESHGSSGNGGGFGFGVPDSDVVGVGIAAGGHGGSSRFGSAGPGAAVSSVTTADGADGTFGAGGSGAASTGSVANSDGGAGGDGLILIFEYSE